MNDTKALATTDNESAGQLARRLFFQGVNDDVVKATLLVCNQYGLDPLLKHVVIIKGNIYITRDGLLHVAHQSEQLDGMEVTLGNDGDFGTYAECRVYRKDMNHPFTYRVYRDEYDSKRGAWQSHPRSMLIKTAEVFCLRRAFDVAITPQEEMETVLTEQPVYAELPPEDAPAPAYNDSAGNNSNDTQSHELPPLEVSLNQMSGEQLYKVQSILPDALGLNAKHFYNRWRKRFKSQALNEIDATLEHFIEDMAIDSEDWAAMNPDSE